MTVLRAVRLGPGAARALHAEPDGTVEIANERGAYLRLGASGYLHAIGPRGPFGPLTIAVAGLTRLVPGWPVRAAGGSLQVGPVRIALALPPCAAAPMPEPARPSAVDAALTAARAAAPPPPAWLRPGIARLAVGDPAAASALAGLGEGLTPAGDDVLAGFAAALAATGREMSPPVSLITERLASPLGLAYLRCAERGELPDRADALLRALLAGEPVAAARRARLLAMWGGSSGFALFWGMQAALTGRAHGADPTAHGAERNSLRSWSRCQTADSSWAPNPPSRSHLSIEREISPAM